MSAARSDLCEVSPIAQRSASTRFDLPQPFGPTTPVSPGSITSSVGSTKDLNPARRSLAKCMRVSRVSGSGLVGQRLEHGVELLEAQGTRVRPVVDDERRRRVDLEVLLAL